MAKYEELKGKIAEHYSEEFRKNNNLAQIIENDGAIHDGIIDSYDSGGITEKEYHELLEMGNFA
ncbi:hypothetical protein [Bacillus mycoides]|uniref:hypothetical protein n=1 Tax=Bacillus mycoides TaxID=1405 RepID=UPI003A7F677A